MCSVRKFKRRMALYSLIVLVIFALVTSALLIIYFATKYNAVKVCCSPNIICNDK